MKIIWLLILFLSTEFTNHCIAQVFDNYSVYSLSPGISFATKNEMYRGFSILANAQAGTGFFHVEVSSTIGFAKEVFMNEYLTLDLAAGYPFKINEYSEALIALSPLSINLTIDGNIGLAALLKYRYGKLFFESKLVLTEYKELSLIHI
jgi:hypothetical protein